MRESATSDPNVDRVIRSWLEVDRHEDVSRVAGSVLDLLDTTPQRRSPWWPARRLPFMNKFVSVGLAAAVVVVAMVIGTRVLGPSATGAVGGAPPASASVTPAPTATANPSPSRVTAPPPTQTFTSTVHGISVSYPERWIVRAATEPWTGAPGVDRSVHPGFDALLHPLLTDHLFLAIASQPIGDSTPGDWVAAQLAGDDGCPATEPITVAGATGLIGADECKVVAIVTAGRGYRIELTASGDNPAAVAPYDMAWFKDVIATVKLHPEDAVDSSPSSSP